MTNQPAAKRGLSFRDGGWVLIGAAILFLAILTWALAPRRPSIGLAAAR